MKILKQFLILIGLLFIGEVLQKVFPLPVPATIYALLILLILLKSNYLLVDSLKELSEFLLNHLSLLFIAPTVSIIQHYQKLADFILPTFFMIVISTLIVLAISGLITQKVMEQTHE